MGLLAVQKALADLERLGIVDVERGSVEHRYRLNFNHYLVQHGNSQKNQITATCFSDARQ